MSVKFKKIIFLMGLFICCANHKLAMANSRSSNESSNNDCCCRCCQEHPFLQAKPEIGIDIGFTNLQFYQNQGDKLLNRKQLPISAFFGFNITENAGIEIGYGEARRRHKTVTLEGGEYAPGAIPINRGQFQVYDTSISTSLPYVSFKYKYPIIKDRLNLFAAVGVTMFKLHASWENIEDSRGPLGTIDRSSRTYDYTIRKNLPLVRIGSYYELNKSFSLRFIATWTQVSKIEECIGIRENGWLTNGIPITLKNKNNVTYSLGIVYKI
jgi:hypothetical protein